MEAAPGRAPRVAAMTGSPLDGLRVIDLGTRIAAPFAAGMLAELGADVIKVEDPGGGDMLRTLGLFAAGRSLFFGVEDRSRRNVTCNLRDAARPGAVPALGGDRRRAHRELPAGNARTMEHRARAAAHHPRHRPDPVLGQDGPDFDQPGLDLTAIARAGLLAITGYADGPPVKSAVVVADP